MIIIQRKRFITRDEFELQDSAMQIKRESGSTRHQTSINYNTLLPEVDQRAFSDRKILVGAIIAFLFSSFLFLLSTAEDGLVFGIIGCIPFVLSLILIWHYRNTKFDSWIFYFKNGSFAFSIDRKRPNEEQASAFVKDLRRRILEMPPSAEESTRELSLSQEIERLGKLLEKKLITEDEFATMKQSLILQLEKSGRTMGFHA